MTAGKFDWDSMEHKKLLMAMLMTAADISAVARPWEVQLSTAETVYAEFFEQGDMERALGVEPAPLLDRRKIMELPKLQVRTQLERQAPYDLQLCSWRLPFFFLPSLSQLGFIDFVAEPLYCHLGVHMAELQPLHDMVATNRQSWEKLKGSYHGFVRQSSELVTQSTAGVWCGMHSDVSHHLQNRRSFCHNLNFTRASAIGCKSAGSRHHCANKHHESSARADRERWITEYYRSSSEADASSDLLSSTQQRRPGAASTRKTETDFWRVHYKKENSIFAHVQFSSSRLEPRRLLKHPKLPIVVWRQQSSLRKSVVFCRCEFIKTLSSCLSVSEEARCNSLLSVIIDDAQAYGLTFARSALRSM